MRKYLGEIGLITTAIIWGSGFVATAIALTFYSAYQILAIRFLIGGLILSLICFQRVKTMTKQVLAKGAFLGSILYLSFALQTVGLQFTTVSKNSFITAINVVIVPLIAYILYKKKLNRFEVIGAILALIGVGLMSLQISSYVINLGDFLTFLCAIGFAFHIVYTAVFVKDEDPIQLTIVQLLTAAAIGIVVSAVRGEWMLTIEVNALLSIIYLGIFSTTIAYFLQTTAQKFVSETKAAIILATEALWGTLFSVIILSEVLTLRMTIGAILILVAIIVAETKVNVAKTILKQSSYEHPRK